MKRIHEAIRWGLEGAVIEGHYLPERQASGFGAGMTEAVIRLFMNLLVQQIELDLKTCLVTHLRNHHGERWWFSLPDSVQHLAWARYEWSRKALGPRRVVRFPDISWLTFGNTLKTLDAMSPDEWRTCLHAETRRRRAFSMVARRIKAFRDYHIAHPKPRDVTTPEIRGLSVASRQLTVTLCPAEWAQACEIVRTDRGFLLPMSLSDDWGTMPIDDGYRRRLLKWWDAHYGDWTKWKVPNNAVERITGSHALISAAPRERRILR